MLNTLQHGGSVFDALTTAYFYIQFIFFADIVVATTVKKSSAELMLLTAVFFHPTSIKKS
jgi:hypothetical protein